MIRDFVEEYNGFVRLNNDEYEHALWTDPLFPRSAKEVFIYGAGYWKNELLMQNIKKAERIAEFKYPK